MMYERLFDIDGMRKWNDYEMTVAPYETKWPIYYEFSIVSGGGVWYRGRSYGHHARPGNVDFASMELLQSRLVRTKPAWTAADPISSSAAIPAGRTV